MKSDNNPSVGQKGGMYCYIMTPFNNQGDVDHSVLERYVDAVIADGADGVTCVASTTEGVYLTESERFATVETVCNVAANRVPVNVGVGALSTRQVLHFAEHAQKSGAATLMLEMQTYILRVNRAATHRHYSEVAGAVDIPIKLYNIPSTTRYDCKPDEIADMADIDGIDSVKDATGDATRVRDIRSLCGDRFSLYCGLHYVALDSYRYGAIGWEGSFHPLIGRYIVELHQTLSAQDFDKGAKLFAKLEPLFQFFKYYGVPQSIKAMSAWSDIKLGTTRRPLSELSLSQTVRLKEILIDLDCF